jgi:predicted nucleotidyltransferase
MNLSTLLSTNKRESILAGILFKESEIGVAEVSRRLKMSKGFVSRFFTLLAKDNILKRKSGKYFISENLNVKIMRIVLSLKRFYYFDFNKYPFVSGAGLYGSSVKGENHEDSDFDIWIKISKRDEEKLARLTAELKNKFGRISPLYLTKEKLEALKKEDLPFYHSLVFGSIKLYGEDIV